MLTKELIDKIYNEMIDIILKDVDDKDKDEISNNYLYYLHKLYIRNNIKSQEDEQKVQAVLDKGYRVVLKIEKKKWENASLREKLLLFKKDKSNDLIAKISRHGFTLATNRLDNGVDKIISIEEAEKNIDIMIKELDNVLEHNKEAASQLVSEGILDYKYACGEDKGLMSFRLSHLVQKEL